MGKIVRKMKGYKVPVSKLITYGNVMYSTGNTVNNSTTTSCSIRW